MRSDALARRIRIIEAACEIFRTSTDIVPLETIADKAGVGIPCTAIFLIVPL